MNIAQQLKKAMEHKGITMYRLSKKVGVHQTTVSNWLNGKSEPKIEQLEKIATALGVEWHELMEVPKTKPVATAQHDDKIKQAKELHRTIIDLNLKKQSDTITLEESRKLQEIDEELKRRRIDGYKSDGRTEEEIAEIERAFAAFKSASGDDFKKAMGVLKVLLNIDGEPDE